MLSERAFQARSIRLAKNAESPQIVKVYRQPDPVSGSTERPRFVPPHIIKTPVRLLSEGLDGQYWMANRR